MQLPEASVPSATPTEYGRLWALHPKIFERLETLEETVGHRFGDRTLLYEALTHRSALMELGSAPVALSLPWNERLEFLGDSVLNLAVSRRLMRGREFAEGDLSRIRAALVNEESLAEAARRINLGRYLVLGKGAAQSGGRTRDSILADGLEALTGAIFVDAGFDAADRAVEGFFEGAFKGDLRALVQTDFKTMLQELTQERLKITPIYEVEGELGPDHEKSFAVRVKVGKSVLGRGEGASKKRASQDAARHALEYLNQNGWEMP